MKKWNNWKSINSKAPWKQQIFSIQQTWQRLFINLHIVVDFFEHIQRIPLFRKEEQLLDFLFRNISQFAHHEQDDHKQIEPDEKSTRDVGQEARPEKQSAVEYSRKQSLF